MTSRCGPGSGAKPPQRSSRRGVTFVWIALSADHGVSSLPDAAQKLHIPAANLGKADLDQQINAALTAKFSPGHPVTYLRFDYPVAWLDNNAFTAVHVSEQDAEKAAGEAIKEAGLRGYYTKSQLAKGEVPDAPYETPIGQARLAREGHCRVM